MRRYEYRHVTALMAEIEAVLNEHGADGWGIAFMQIAAPHVHVVLFREKQD